MNDLLRGSINESRPRNESYGARDVELGMPRQADDAPASGDPRLKRFFEEVNDIKNDMQQMKRKLRMLQDSHDESKLVTRAKDMKAIKARMENDVNSVLKMAKGVKSKIERLDRENKQSRVQPGCEEGTGTDRTRTNMTNNLKKKLKDLMVQFQELRGKIQEEYKETVERRYYTVTGERPAPELVDQLVHTGDSEAIFQKAIQDQGRGQLLDAIAEIQERTEAVKDLESQLKELHQIFLDMAVLVEAQGELVDNIENNVDCAKEHVNKATTQLVIARKTQLNTRKWLFIGLIALIIIIIVIIVLVIKPWQFAKTN